MAKNFTLPTPEQLTSVRRELKLNAVQARKLKDVISNVHADLEGYYRTRIGRGPRKVRMDRLRAVDQAIGKLITLLGKDPGLINEDLPFEARNFIAQCASSEIITVITGEEVSDGSARVLYKEQKAGFLHGASILLAQLRLIRDPIQSVLSEKSTDPGGPEPNHALLALIRDLADAAPEIIGRRATGTAKGKFEDLVGAVFEVLGIKTRDLRKAIENALYRKPLRSKTRK